MTHFVQSITQGWDIVELFGSGQFAAVNKVDPRPLLTTSATGGDSTGTSSWGPHPRGCASMTRAELSREFTESPAI